MLMPSICYRCKEVKLISCILLIPFPHTYIYTFRYQFILYITPLKVFFLLIRRLRIGRVWVSKYGYIILRLRERQLEERVLAYLGSPTIFHSDSGREFVNQLL